MKEQVTNKICIVCGVWPSVYEKVRHCRRCHSVYNRKNYDEHYRRKTNVGTDVAERNFTRGNEKHYKPMQAESTQQSV